MARNWLFSSPRRTSSHRSAQSKLSMESLEPRLVLSWSGAPPASMTVPKANKVSLNSQSDAVGVGIIKSTEVNYLQFNAKATGKYVISTSVPFDNLDTVVALYNADGVLLAWNNDLSGSSSDSSLTWDCVKGTRYYIGITNLNASTSGAYMWSIDGSALTLPDDQYENNDTQLSAYHLGTPTSPQTWNSLKMYDSEDWYSFTTTAKGTASDSVSINFLNSEGNLQLQLYNAAGKKLRSSQGKTDAETVSLEGLNAGTYFVRVFSNRGVNNPNYSLTIDPPTTANTSGFQITVTMSGLTTGQKAIFQQAAQRWQQIIVGDLPDAQYNGRFVDDVWIEAKSAKIDGVNGVLGEAGPDALRVGSNLPVHGIMKFDKADLKAMEQNGTLYGVVLHEMGHVLGLGTLWSYLGMISGSGTNNPIYVGAQATAEYNSIFSTAAAGVPVENTGGEGTIESHWRETVFGNELMTGWIDGANMPISRVTVGALADLGYQVNMAAADVYVPGSNLMAAAKESSNTAAGSATAFDIALAPGKKKGKQSAVGKQQVLQVASLQANLVDAVIDAIPRRLEAEEPALQVADRANQSNAYIDQMWDEFAPSIMQQVA